MTITQEMVPAAAPPSGRDIDERGEQLKHFLGELERMTPEERIRGSRHSFNLRERTIYAARYPEEVPTVNGELEWIAATVE